MIYDEIESFVEILGNSVPADFEINNQSYCRIMERLVNSRNLKSLNVIGGKINHLIVADVEKDFLNG